VPRKPSPYIGFATTWSASMLISNNHQSNQKVSFHCYQRLSVPPVLPVHSPTVSLLLRTKGICGPYSTAGYSSLLYGCKLALSNSPSDCRCLFHDPSHRQRYLIDLLLQCSTTIISSSINLVLRKQAKSSRQTFFNPLLATNDRQGKPRAKPLPHQMKP